MNVTPRVDVIAGTSGSLEHSPNGTADAQIAELRQEYDLLRQRTDLTVTNRYFVENHTVQSVEGTILISGNQAQVRVVVGLASQLDRAPGREEQAYLDGRHAGLDCSVIDQECLRSRRSWSYNATALPFSYAPGSVRRDYWRN